MWTMDLVKTASKKWTNKQGLISHHRFTIHLLIVQWFSVSLPINSHKWIHHRPINIFILGHYQYIIVLRLHHRLCFYGIRLRLLVNYSRVTGNLLFMASHFVLFISHTLLRSLNIRQRIKKIPSTLRNWLQWISGLWYSFAKRHTFL